MPDKGIVIEVYRDTAPFTLVEVLNGRMEPQALVELGKNGGGKFTIHRDDPKIVADPTLLDYRNLIRVRANGVVIGGFPIQTKKLVIVGEGEKAAEAWEITGEGLLSGSRDAVVYPPGGLKKGSKETRFFNFASEQGSWYNSAQWVNATRIHLWNSPGNYWSTAPANWPDAPNAWWIGDRTGPYQMPMGTSYYRHEFTTVDSAPTQYSFFFTIDDQADVYVDGELLLTTAEHQHYETVRLDLTLSAGNHVIALKGTNSAVTGGPTAILGALFRVGDASAPTSAQLISTTGNSTWKIMPYPAEEPGWTPGDIVLTLINEAKARGVRFFNNITPTFTVTQDSAGQAWTKAPASFDVGSTYETVFESLEELACDFYLDPDTLQLHAYRKRGVDRSLAGGSDNPVILSIGKNLIEADETGQANIANSLLVRTSDGWVLRNPDTATSSSLYGTVEGQMTTDLSEKSSVSLTQELFRQKALPETSATFVLIPFPGATPFVDFNVGDYVSAPGTVRGILESRRVMSISITENPANGQIIYAVEFDTIFQDRQSELEKVVSRATGSGTVGGSAVSNSTGRPDTVIKVPTPTVIINVPDAPVGLNVTSDPRWSETGAAVADVTIQWAPVLSSGNTPITDVIAYEVWGKKTEDMNFSLLTSVATLSTKFIAYEAGSSWDFRVRAVSRTSGVGEFSEPTTHVLAFPAADLAAPPAPVLDSKRGTVTISWDGTLGGEAAPVQFSHMVVVRVETGDPGTFALAGSFYTLNTSDNTVEVGQSYDYALLPIDSQGNAGTMSNFSTIVVEGVLGGDIDDAITDAIEDAKNDAEAAIVLANGKNKNYYQASKPTGGTYSQGDLWFDTDDNYKLYVFSPTANDFVLAQDSKSARDAAQTAQDAAQEAANDATEALTAVSGAVVSLITEYAVNSSETTAPTSGWSTATPTRTPGSFIWSRAKTTYGDNTTTTSSPVLLTGNRGATGTAGTPGVGMASSLVTYQVSSSGTTAPTGTWTVSPSATSPGQFLWTRTVITWTDSTTTTTYSVAAHGATGPSGANGADGVSVTGAEVTYRASSSGTTAPTGTWSASVPSVSAGQFLWTRTITNYSNSTSTTSYSVGRMGTNGSQGTPGTPGADGQTSYLHVAYATNATGTAGFSTTDPSGKTYMGTYTDFTEADSTNPALYSWVLIKGADGADGADGATGPTGPAGKGISSSTVTYQASSSGTTAPTGTWSATVPSVSAGQFLWTRTVIDFTDGASQTTYSVARSGTNGSTGPAGAEGRSVSSITPYFLLVTSGASAPAAPTTRPPGGGWTLTEPDYVSNTELYRADLVVFSDNTFGWTAVSKVSSYTASTQAVTVANLAQESANGKIKASQTDPGHDVGRIWFQTDANGDTVGIKISNGSAWTSYTLMADQILVPSSVGTISLANGAITAGKLAANAIEAGSAVIAEGAITNAQIANLDAVKISTGTLAAARIGAGTIDASKIAANAITAQKLLIADLSNALENPYFEVANFVGWTRAGNSSGWTIQTSSATDINKYIQRVTGATATALSTYINNYRLPVQAGKRLRISGESYNLGNISATVGIQWYNSAGAALSTSTLALTGNETEWDEFDALEADVPENAYFASLRIADTGVANTTLRLAKLRFAIMNSGELVVDGAILGRMIKSQTIESDNIAVGAIRTSHINAEDLNSLDLGSNTSINLVIGNTVAPIQTQLDTASELAAGAATKGSLEAVQGGLDDVRDAQNATQSEVANLQTWFRVDNVGAHMGQTGNPFQTHIKPDRFEITYNDTVTTWWESTKMVVPTLEAVDAVIANHQFSKFGTGTNAGSIIRRISD